MQTAAKSEFISVADYLAAEEAGQVRHEYLGGMASLKMTLPLADVYEGV